MKGADNPLANMIKISLQINIRWLAGRRWDRRSSIII
jgi:hypothetical protein